ncbi:MAG TPA: alpha/beta fold hydrolase [Candidatus Dormibacteraeota bacterium]|jgi:pimeloyl-ACP methyl ester carboxylesterase|nr:alpha/beta fold hydrolase [Candidatus Dormibacteraeota bacterium]
MFTTTSDDGTTIAYDRSGDGPPAVLVAGAFGDRHAFGDLAGQLSGRFTVVTYDRRGRGDSGDTPPYEVQRELDDLEAVIQAVGGGALVHGMSSGAVLALRGAASGVHIDRLSVMEPPYRLGGLGTLPEGFLATMAELTSSGRRGETVSYFMSAAIGLPEQVVEGARQSPAWPAMEAVSHTLLHDSIIVGEGEVPSHLLGTIRVPTLCIDSTGSPAWLRAGAEAVAGLVPGAVRRSLEGGFHEAPPAVLAATLTEFFEESPA